MNEEFEGKLISVEDEDGNQFDLEFIGSMEMDGREYCLLLPTDMDEDDADFGYIILERTESDGEEIYLSIDDEDHLNFIYDSFMALLYDEDEETESE